MSDEGGSKAKTRSKDFVKKSSPRQIEAVTNFLNDKAGGVENDRCPVCASVKNIVIETEYAVPTGQIEPLLGIGPHAPCYATICQNCGYMRFFNKPTVDRIMQSDASGDQSEGDE